MYTVEKFAICHYEIKSKDALVGPKQPLNSHMPWAGSVNIVGHLHVFRLVGVWQIRQLIGRIYSPMPGSFPSRPPRTEPRPL